MFQFDIKLYVWVWFPPSLPLTTIDRIHEQCAGNATENLKHNYYPTSLNHDHKKMIGPSQDYVNVSHLLILNNFQPSP